MVFSFNFPVGNSAYNPIIIANSGRIDSYSVRVVDGTPPSPFDASKVVNRSWIVSEGTVGGSSINMAAYWNSPTQRNYTACRLQEDLDFGMVPHGHKMLQQWEVQILILIPLHPSQVCTFALGKDDAFISAATTYTWNGATNGSWGTATNWTPNGVPTATDNVIFNVIGTNPTNFNTSQTVNNLSLIGTGSL